MTKLNLTQAAKAAGIARGTLYRHIKDGKVTCEKNDKGERVILAFGDPRQQKFNFQISAIPHEYW